MRHLKIVINQITKLVEDAKLKYEALLLHYEEKGFNLYPFNSQSDDCLTLLYGCVATSPDLSYSEDRLIVLEVNIISPKIKHKLQDVPLTPDRTIELLELYQQC